MSWIQIGINLLVMATIYVIGYGISYFFSKRWSKKNGDKINKGDK